MAERLIWEFFSYFGDIAYWLGFAVAFLIISPLLEKKDKTRTRWILVSLIPVVLISYFVVLVLQYLLLVPRPCAGFEWCPLTPSFPSGHAAIAFSSATIIAATLRKRRYFLFFGLAFLVALSRVMLKVHYVHDVITGAGIGIFIAAVWLMLKKINLGWFYTRKLIHLSAISILFVEYLLGKNIVLILIAAGSFLYLTSEILRKHRIGFPLLQDLVITCTEPPKRRFLARIKDFLGLTKREFFATPLYFAAGIFILLLLFPTRAFYFGFLAAVIGDGMAGIFGRKFGRNKIFYSKQKTLEGSLAFFLSILFPYLFLTDFFRALLLALFATFLESWLTRFENLILPLGVGAVALFI